MTVTIPGWHGPIVNEPAGVDDVTPGWHGIVEQAFHVERRPETAAQRVATARSRRAARRAADRRAAQGIAHELEQLADPLHSTWGQQYGDHEINENGGFIVTYHDWWC